METQQVKKRHSALSIIAFIFSLTIYLSCVGVILAIIDIARKKENKHLFSYLALGIGGAMTLIMVTACVASITGDRTVSTVPVIAEQTTVIPTENTEQHVTEAAEAPTEIPTAEPTIEATAEPQKELNILDELLIREGISSETAELIFQETEDAFSSQDNPIYDPAASSDQIREWEDGVIASIAEKHGVSPEIAKTIYVYASLGYLMHYDTENVPIANGKLVSATISGTKLIVKAKIESSWNNDLTIKQNYINACDIIRSFGDNHFSELQYWAVADMVDGSEGKVISFTVPKDVIDYIANNQFADTTLGDYVVNLWIHQSLRN